MGFLESESKSGVGGVGALIASRSIRRVGTPVPTKRLRANDMRLQRGGGYGATLKNCGWAAPRRCGRDAPFGVKPLPQPQPYEQRHVGAVIRFFQLANF